MNRHRTVVLLVVVAALAALVIGATIHAATAHQASLGRWPIATTPRSLRRAAISSRRSRRSTSWPEAPARPRRSGACR